MDEPKQPKRIPKEGDLIYGGKVFKSEGITEWFDFPRYRVVGLHINGEDMFLETLNSEGKVISKNPTIMPIVDNQWSFEYKPIQESKQPKRITREEAIEFLWMIIDDIDSYSDLAKDNDKLYRTLVEERQGDRWGLPITTDGYNLDISALDANQKEK